MMPVGLVILGRQGSGKGTQAMRIAGSTAAASPAQITK